MNFESRMLNPEWPHKGQISFITDINGDATQHLQYACTEPVECVPFGEDLVHQQETIS